MSFILDRMTIPRRLLADPEADRLMANLRSLHANRTIAPEMAAAVDAASRRYGDLTAARDEAQRILAAPIDERTSSQLVALRGELERLHAAWVEACKWLTGGRASAGPRAAAKAGIPKLRFRRRSRTGATRPVNAVGAD